MMIAMCFFLSVFIKVVCVLGGVCVLHSNSDACTCCSDLGRNASRRARERKPLLVGSPPGG